MRHVPYSIESVLDFDSLVCRVELSRLVVPQKQNTHPAGFVSYPYLRFDDSRTATGPHTQRVRATTRFIFPLVWGICWYSFVPEKRGFGGLFAREAVSHSSGFLEKEGLKVCL